MRQTQPMRALFSLYEKKAEFLTLAVEFMKRGGSVLATDDTLRAIKDLSSFQALDMSIRQTQLHSIARVTACTGAGHGALTTLSPYLHGAIQRRGKRVHVKKRRVATVDLVCVTLAPDDVEGVALIFSARKGWKILVTAPHQCASVLEAIDAGTVDEPYLLDLYAEADAVLVSHIAQAPRGAQAPLIAIGRHTGSLRYGENPRQWPATRYASIRSPHEHFDPLSRANFTQIAGEPTSYTNETDFRLVEVLRTIDAAYRKNFGSDEKRFIAVIGKHGNPCGAAVRLMGSDVTASKHAVLKAAVEGDPASAFGGCVVTNFEIGNEEAEILRMHEWREAKLWPRGRPYDLVIAPSFREMTRLERPKQKAKLFENPHLRTAGEFLPVRTSVRQVLDQYLVQQTSDYIADLSDDRWRVHGNADLIDQFRRSCVLAWALAATTDSNAIAIVADERLLGSGVKAVSRVRAVSQALDATPGWPQPRFHRGTVAASDSFFPFRDGTERLFEAGVSIIMATYGSVRDQEVAETVKDIYGNVRDDRALLWIDDKIGRTFSGH